MIFVAPELIVTFAVIFAAVSFFAMTWPFIASEMLILTGWSRGQAWLGGLVGMVAGISVAVWQRARIDTASFRHPWWWIGGSVLYFALLCLFVGIAHRQIPLLVVGIVGLGIACLWS